MDGTFRVRFADGEKMMSTALLLGLVWSGLWMAYLYVIMKCFPWEMLHDYPEGEYGSVMNMGSWEEAKEWLEGVVFDDPAVSDRVERILHPEHFPERKSSVLRRLKEKKDEVREKNRKGLEKEKPKAAPDLFVIP